MQLFCNQKLYQGEHEMALMQMARDCRVPPVRQLNPEVPEAAAAVVRKALFPDRAQRFQSAAEFLKALEVAARRSNWTLTVDALKPLLSG